MTSATPVRRAAVRVIKPWVSNERWERLRQLGGAKPKPVVQTTPAVAAKPKAEPQVVPLSKRSLPELAMHFGTDKWGTHRYAQHYERHLGHLKTTPFTLFEIGIGGYKRDGQGGASLRMWKHFFPKAQILGLDIEDKSFVNEKRIQAFRGSQTNETLLRTIMDTADDVRVIIDDGSHRPEHIRRSFEILFPLLEDGGVYVIEDTQTSYWPRFGGSADPKDDTTTMALVKDLIDGLNYEEYHDADYVPTYSEANIVAVFCYHNIVFIQKGANNEGSSGFHH